MRKSHPFLFRSVKKSKYYELNNDCYNEFNNEDESTFLFVLELSTDDGLAFDRLSTGDIRIGDVFYSRDIDKFYIFTFHFYEDAEYPRSFGFENLDNIREKYLIEEMLKYERIYYMGNIFQHERIRDVLAATSVTSKNYSKMISYYKELNSNIKITTKEYYQKKINDFDIQKHIYQIDKSNEIWDIYFDVSNIKNCFDEVVFINNYLKTGQFLVYKEHYFKDFISKYKRYEEKHNSINKKEKEMFEILKYIIFYFDSSGLIKYKSLQNGKEYTLNDLVSMKPKPIIRDNYYAYYHLTFDNNEYVENFIRHI